MKITRRNFSTIAALAAGSVGTGFSVTQCFGESTRCADGYATLDALLKQPVLDRSLFPDRVVIETLELLQDRKNFICRVRSSDGAQGISIGHPFISKDSYPMFNGLLRKHFIKKDARDLDALVFNACERSTKRQGIPLNVQVATIEFAILDMLGNIAGKPVAELFGGIRNPQIPIYLGHHLMAFRKLEPEESLARMVRDVERTKAKAVKLRSGVGDYLGTNREFVPGRAEKLAKLARETFGSDFTLMMDGNGTYDVQGAIRFAKVLEGLDFYFFEEPLPWQWYEEQRELERALNIRLAGGEVEFDMHRFRWLMANQVLQVVQPDLFYFGGMIRSLQVARMAEAAGAEVSPHMSANGLGYLYMLHMVAATPAAGKFHEFKMFNTRDPNGTMIPMESKGAPFTCVDGVIPAPTGAGLGIRIDPDYIKSHKVLPD
jgi:L-alanine-DL-glutamate epimerase-like enolase superfamily enzyme